MRRPPERLVRRPLHRGTIAIAPLLGGYGFIDPDHGGGQLLFRGESSPGDLQLQIGEAVQYAVTAGSFAVEAVGVRRLSIDLGRRP
jgi:cold shock CspA family protein